MMSCTLSGDHAVPHQFHSIVALRGDGLRPELQQLFTRLAVDPHSELFTRADGMLQSGPDFRHSEPVLRAASSSPSPPFAKQELNDAVALPCPPRVSEET
jgi:hypothetical protein